MTETTRNKIIEAIAECNNFIAKESPRDEKLRPADVAQCLAHCYSHREKLQKMLDDAK
jgi:hypothetical protein